jgi:anti-sigma regulatory factor (Ser/Thr protein kinase)
VSPHCVGKTLARTAARANLELELQRNVAAPATARAAVNGMCNDLELSGSARDTLMLLVSEVVSNAVLHSSGPAGAPVLVAATVGEDIVHIAVTDAGRGFTPRSQDQLTGGGYGLYLLDRAASRWGIDHVGGTRVWFELSRTVSMAPIEVER